MVTNLPRICGVLQRTPTAGARSPGLDNFLLAPDVVRVCRAHDQRAANGNDHTDGPKNNARIRKIHSSSLALSHWTASGSHQRHMTLRGRYAIRLGHAPVTTVAGARRPRLGTLKETRHAIGFTARQHAGHTCPVMRAGSRPQGIEGHAGGQGASWRLDRLRPVRRWALSSQQPSTRHTACRRRASARGVTGWRRCWPPDKRRLAGLTQNCHPFTNRLRSIARQARRDSVARTNGQSEQGNARRKGFFALFDRHPCEPLSVVS